MENQIIINNNGTYVAVIRNWLDKNKSIQLCNKLRDNLQWRRDKVLIAGKYIDQPRRTYSMGDPGIKFHRYSGTEMPIEPWIPEVMEIRDRIVAETKIAFNACLINEYETGKNSIGWHSDREVMSALKTVVTVSLGGSRDFQIRPKEHISSERKTITIKLNSGDCMVMTGECQRDYQHCVPKRVHGEYRISLTFRYLNNN